jgi:hypothetical protein
MRIFNIERIDFYDDLVSIYFSIYQFHFWINFSNDEYKEKDNDGISLEMCARLEEYFYDYDRYEDYQEDFTLNELNALLNNPVEIKIAFRKQKIDKLILIINNKLNLSQFKN